MGSAQKPGTPVGTVALKTQISGRGAGSRGIGVGPQQRSVGAKLGRKLCLKGANEKESLYSYIRGGEPNHKKMILGIAGGSDTQSPRTTPKIERKKKVSLVRVRTYGRHLLRSSR